MLDIQYLIDMARHYTLEEVDAFLADPGRRTDEFAGILANAAEKGRLDLTLHMVQNYNRISRGRDFKSIALHAAAVNGHTALVRELCAMGIDPEGPGYELRPLYMAALLNHIDIVDELIKAGAHLEAANKNGKTALMKAREEGHEEIVRRLLAAGAKDLPPVP